MKFNFIKIICFCSSMFFFGGQIAASPTTSNKITLEDIFLNGKYQTKSVPGFNTMNDENYYAGIEKVENDYQVFQYKIDGKKKDKLILSTSDAPVKNGSTLDKYDFSVDEKGVLLYFNQENIYRRSIKYDVVYYNREKDEFIKISDEPILHASLNPQGNKVAYVFDNNLYYFDLITRLTKQITHDGKWNYIINGNCDWVYEEEFSFTKAYEWSPDGRYIAFYRFDESNVKEYAMTKFNGLYPEQYIYKYPKAGEDNSIVSIHTYAIGSERIEKVDIGSNIDIYIPRIKWANDSDLCILRLNRHQNKLDYLFYSVLSKETQVSITDENEYYVDILDPVIFIEGGTKMIFQSEMDGYNHLYIFNRNNKKVKQITEGHHDIDNVLGYDEESSEIFFTAGITSPLNRSLYAININDKNLRNVSKTKGWARVQAFPSLKKFLIHESSIDELPQSYLISKNGNKLSILENNDKLRQTLKNVSLGEVQIDTFLAADHKTKLNAWVMYPVHFDSTKKYPVLMYQYSGPGSQEVKNAFPLGNYWWHQYMAQEGYIIVCVDGRGTGARGEAFKKSTYLQLGKYESDDQIAVAQQLQDWKFVDASRIGIWGWSYGGFMSAICILKGNDVFKTAVSVAPVTNWRLYDNIYTERFMRTPQENPSGYDENSPIDMAVRLKGNLLIIHGTADDNVHFQNAVMLTDALIKANKQFESMYYPDKDHGIYGGNTRYQLFTKITNYLKEKL